MLQFSMLTRKTKKKTVSADGNNVRVVRPVRNEVGKFPRMQNSCEIPDELFGALGNVTRLSHAPNVVENIGPTCRLGLLWKQRKTPSKELGSLSRESFDFRDCCA